MDTETHQTQKQYHPDTKLVFDQLCQSDKYLEYAQRLRGKGIDPLESISSNLYEIDEHIQHGGARYFEAHVTLEKAPYAAFIVYNYTTEAYEIVVSIGNESIQETKALATTEATIMTGLLERRIVRRDEQEEDRR